MILKIYEGKIKGRDTNTSYIRGGVRSIHQKSLDRDIEIDEYDSSLLGDKPVNNNVWRLFIVDDNGNERYILAEIGNVYLMNDEGKTVDRF